jgi:hypothetical protein
MADGELDIDALRRQFADRLSAVIGDRRDPQNLQQFHEKTGRPIPKLIQWRNPKHRNWPDVKSLLQMCFGADVSPTWLLFGRGAQRLSDVRRGAMPSKQAAIDEIIEILTEFGESERRTIKSRIVATARKITAIFNVEDSDREQPEAIPTMAGDPTEQNPERVLSFTDPRDAQSGRRGKRR